MRAVSRTLALIAFSSTGCVAFHPQILSNSIPSEVDQLEFAANALERGDDASAIAHLKAHLDDQPEDAFTRLQLAEREFRSERLNDAQSSFEHFVAQAQLVDGPIRNSLLHAHTRLMLIAQQLDDEYSEQLHRGIGLWVLVQQWDHNPARRDESHSNETLQKAARALRLACNRKSDCCRPNFYLALVYERMGQLSPSRTSLKKASNTAPFDLTTWERDQLSHKLEQ